MDLFGLYCDIDQTYYTSSPTNSTILDLDEVLQPETIIPLTAVNLGSVNSSAKERAPQSPDFFTESTPFFNCCPSKPVNRGEDKLNANNNNNIEPDFTHSNTSLSSPLSQSSPLSSLSSPSLLSSPLSPLSPPSWSSSSMAPHADNNWKTHYIENGNSSIADINLDEMKKLTYNLMVVLPKNYNLKIEEIGNHQTVTTNYSLRKVETFFDAQNNRTTVVLYFGFNNNREVFNSNSGKLHTYPTYKLLIIPPSNSQLEQKEFTFSLFDDHNKKRTRDRYSWSSSQIKRKKVDIIEMIDTVPSSFDLNSSSKKKYGN